jgi:hypothetical protein
VAKAIQFLPLRFFMASSPDSALLTEHAGSTVSPRPTLLRNLSFWLLAMLLGSACILVAPVLKSGFTSQATVIFLKVGGLATLLSLAALPLLLLCLPWALTASSVGLRWLRVFTLQGLSLGGLVALGYLLAGSMLGPAALVGGAVYFLAGLLAAAVVYWPWLGRLQ